MEQVHRGEIVRSRVGQVGMKISTLAKAIGYERSYMYTLFDNEVLPYDIIVKIGKAIHWDFSKDFPEVFTGTVSTVGEAPERYGSEDPVRDLEKCKEEVVMWRERYYSLMEEHNKVMKGAVGKLIREKK